MKKFKELSFLMILLFFALSFESVSQNVPLGINYQGIANDGTGNPVANGSIGIKISIYSGSATGTLQWEETHAALTNQFGLFSIVIGKGTTTGAGASANFGLIDWGSANHYLKIALDITGGTNYVVMDNSQLLSVPYSLYSEKANSISGPISLNALADVDTAGTKTGKTLKWNGSQWMPANDNDSDTAKYSYTSGKAHTADTATYCLTATPSDTAIFAFQSDSSLYSNAANNSQNAKKSIYSDTANYALNCANMTTNDWRTMGNSGIVSSTNFIGTTNAADLVMKTNNTERLRITSLGKVGIGTTAPVATVHIVGNDGFISQGTFGSGALPATGAGTRMMWYPKKASFRAGYASTTQWDDVNIGNYSYATGYNSYAKGNGSVAMGQTCGATDSCSVAMGYTSVASGKYSVAMGNVATASGFCSVAMGRGPTASGIAAQAIGYHVTASGDYSTAFGDYTTADGFCSTAMGYHSHTNGKNGTFIFADYSTTAGYTLATAANQFFVKASGGTIFYSNSGLTSGVSLAPGGGAWLTLSDRNQKAHFKSVNGEMVLTEISKMDIPSWNYKSQSPDIRHIGPMAQDFYAAFKFGESDTTITTTDIDGISLLAIQALAKRTKELNDKAAEIQQLTNQVNALLKQKASLEKRLTIIEESLKKNDAFSTSSKEK